MRKILTIRLVTLVALTTLLLLLVFAPVTRADGGDVAYEDRFGYRVGKFVDGNLVCYIIFAVRDGDHTVLQCYNKGAVNHEQA